MSSSGQDYSIMRLALGRAYRIGSLYSTVDDTFINSKDLAIGSFRLKRNYNCKRSSHSINCGKTLGDKIKIFGAQPELDFNIMTQSDSFSQNQFIQFLREQDYRFGDPLMKRAVFKIEFSYRHFALDKGYSLNESLSTNCNNLYVVTEATYGFQLIGVLWFINEKNLEENEIIKNFSNIVENLRQKNFDFAYLNDAFRNNLKVDFIDNCQLYPHRSLEFGCFLSKLNHLLRTKCSAPIQFNLIPYNFLKNGSKMNLVDLNFVYNFHTDFNKHISLLLNKWHELNIYSEYYESSKKAGVKRVLDELYKLIDYAASSLSKEVRQTKESHRFELNSIYNVIDQIVREVNNKANSWAIYEPSPAELKEIKFFKKIAILIESSWDKKQIKLNDGYILCYSMNLKQQNQDQWKTRLGEFMYLMNDNQAEMSFYVLNYDICKPLDFTCFDEIQLAKVENGVITSLHPRVRENRNEPITRKEEDEFNIILLGETGVGKSTFINAFANYIRFETLEQASNNTQSEMYLIESCFHYTNDDFKTEKIQVGEAKNEVFVDGQSSTQCAQAYAFPIGNNRIVRIIDTPGMGDSRGHRVDKKNFDETIEFLSKFKHINAICFLVKPNNARLHPGFRYCFKELLSHLHKDTTKNLVFCFTNTRSTQYRPGETFGALKSFLAEVETASNVKIQFDKDNIFCVDNEAFRYLMLKNCGKQFPESEQKNFANSWRKSSDNSKSMIGYIINGLRPLETKQIIILNDLQQFNGEWAKIASDLLKSMVVIKYQLFIEKNELERNNKDKKRDKSVQNNMWKAKNDKIVKLTTDLLATCSKLSSIMRMSSLAVYNDDFEAYLGELLKESNDRFMLTDKDEKISHFFKNAMNMFLELKKQAEDGIKSGKLIFEDNESEILVNKILDIKEEFKNGNF